MSNHPQRSHAARVRFILKDYKSGGETLIYLTISVGGNRVKWSTREKTAPKDWDRKARRAKVKGRNATANQDLNGRLNGYAETALALYSDWNLDAPAGFGEIQR